MGREEGVKASVCMAWSLILVVTDFLRIHISADQAESSGAFGAKNSGCGYFHSAFAGGARLVPLRVRAAKWHNRAGPMHDGRRVLVIVPAYNEGRVITDTVERLFAAGYQVVVVDDGSSDETGEVGRLPIVYLRHPVNLGQGAALQTGMTYALRAGAEIAVHFDADGQHDCGQIERLIAPIVEGQADVVFGSRFLRRQDREQVPWKKRILLRGGILVSWAMTGMLLSDTHNGFRAHVAPGAGAGVQLQENGLAHATEIMQRVREGGMRYVEVPITISYSGVFATEGPETFGIAEHLFDLIMAKLTK